jgi:hypothetical protein
MTTGGIRIAAFARAAKRSATSCERILLRGHFSQLETACQAGLFSRDVRRPSTPGDKSVPEGVCGHWRVRRRLALIFYDEQNQPGLPSLYEGNRQLKKIPLITLLFVPVRTI